MTANHVAREAVPWPEIREHVIKSFLNVDEAAALRDSVDHLQQSAFESEASFTRTFRDLAQKAYPVPRNLDQSRILVKAYARGIRSPAIAVKMIEQTNPQTLPQAMAWVAGFSERIDAVSRLGLRQVNERDEMPMEIAALPPMSSAPISSPLSPQETATQMLGKLLRSQDKLMRKVSKLEADQNFGQGSSCYSAGSSDKRHGRLKQPPKQPTPCQTGRQMGVPVVSRVNVLVTSNVTAGNNVIGSPANHTPLTLHRETKFSCFQNKRAPSHKYYCFWIFDPHFVGLWSMSICDAAVYFQCMGVRDEYIGATYPRSPTPKCNW